MTYHGIIALDEDFTSPQGIHYQPNTPCHHIGQEWYDSIDDLYKANPMARFYRIFAITTDLRIQISPTTNSAHNITVTEELKVTIDPDPVPFQLITA